MKKINNSNFENLKDIIESIDFNYNPDDYQRIENLQKYWEDTIGNKISKLTKVYSFSNDNKLTVSCADSFVSNELYLEKAKILKIMNRKAEETGIKIEDIKFDYKKWKEKTMNKKLKGFSLAELLISLLIISIVLSAAIPTLTKKSGANREFIWSWANQNNSAYFGLGANQSAILGYQENPTVTKLSTTSDLLLDLFYDNDNINVSLPQDEAKKELRKIGKINVDKIPFNGTGDKFVILKKSIIAKNSGHKESNFANSHISFYTLKNPEDSTTPATINDLRYAGRITMDRGNIAIGMGSLQNQDWVENDESLLGENIALGHFSLLRNSSGIRNTAIGKKALSWNETGSYNTSLGFGALFNLGAVDNGDNIASLNIVEPEFENTALGAYSQQHNNHGKMNTSVGAHSLKNLKYSPEYYNKTGVIGDSNTVMGFGSMLKLISGNENTAIGTNACADTTLGSNNICIGSFSGYAQNNINLYEDNYGVYIGSNTARESTDEAYAEGAAPLINGHSRRTNAKLPDSTDVKFHQELTVNAKQVVFRPFNASFDAFKFESMMGKAAANSSQSYDEGYGLLGANDEEKKARWARAYFNLRDTNKGTGSDDGTSVSLIFTGGYSEKLTKRIAMFDANDPWLPETTPKLADFNFNKMLTFAFPYVLDESNKIYINGENVPFKTTETLKFYPVILNKAIQFEQDPNVTYEATTEYPILRFNKDPNSKWQSLFTFGKTQVITKKDSFEIFQTGSNKQFMVQHGNSDDAPVLQFKDGKFIVNHAPEAEITPKTLKMKSDFGEIHIGSGGDANDICYKDACLHKIGGELETLKGQINSLSDIRLKNVSGDNTAGLKEINALEVKNYTFKNDKEKTQHVGVIAQQLQKIFPNAVTKDKDGYLRIRTEDIFYAMVNSIKDLFKQLQDLTAKITGLDSRLTELEKQNKLLQEQNKLLKKQNKAIEKRLAKLEKQTAK